MAGNSSGPLVIIISACSSEVQFQMVGVRVMEGTMYSTILVSRVDKSPC